MLDEGTQNPLLNLGQMRRAASGNTSLSNSIMPCDTGEREWPTGTPEKSQKSLIPVADLSVVSSCKGPLALNYLTHMASLLGQKGNKTKGIPVEEDYPEDNWLRAQQQYYTPNQIMMAG